MSRLRLLALLAAAAALPARAQTMLDQELRLVEIHSLLLPLPAQAPGAYRAGQLGVGLEGVGIPTIDGTTGGKVQITASDRTRIFPRPRLTLGLPAPEGWRAFAGAAYIPPLKVNGVSSHLGALEAGLAWAPGPWALGLRAHGLVARSESPVTDPRTRDRLNSTALGADVSGAWRLGLAWAELTPYLSAGVVHVDGTFHVTSDGYVLKSARTNLALGAGLRLLWRERVEVVGDLTAYPGRLVHPSVRAAYLFDLGG